jgi:hypothetical protein
MRAASKLGFALFSATLVLSPASAQTGDPVPLPVGQVVRARIDRAEEVDRYQLRLGRRQEVLLLARTLRDGEAVELSVKDPDGRDVAIGYGETKRFGYDSDLLDQSAAFGSDDPGVYTLEFRGRRSDGRPAYEFQAMLTHTGVEPTDAFAGAGDLPNRQSGMSAINHSGDIDRYRITLRRGEEVTLYARTVNADEAVEVNVTDPDGNDVGIGYGTSKRYGYDSDLDDQAATFRADQTGVYTIQVDARGRDARPAYEFELNIMGRPVGFAPAEPEIARPRPPVASTEGRAWADAVRAVLEGARLSPEDLAGLTQAQLELLRNTIYARHGRPFQRADLRQYFASQSWYQARGNYTEASLTAADRANIEIVQRLEGR